MAVLSLLLMSHSGLKGQQQALVLNPSITICSKYTEKAQKACFPALVTPTYKPLTQLSSKWEYNLCNSLLPQMEVRKLLHVVDGVPRTGKRQQGMNSYRPHFMYQSRRTNTGGRPEKGFQMSFKRETKTRLRIPHMKSQNRVKKTD